MAVRQKGSKWQADVTHKGQRLPRYSFDTKEEAEAWEMEAKAALKVGKPVPVPTKVMAQTSDGVRRKATNITLTMAYEETKKVLWDRDGWGRTAQLYAAQWLNFLGPDIPVADITEAHLDSFVEAMRKKGNADVTINKKLSVMSEILKKARRMGAIQTVPSFERDKLEKGTNRIRFLREQEEEAVIKTFQLWGKEDHADATVILIDTGFRGSELWKLDSRDVDLKTNVIHLWDTKTAYPRSVPMTKRVRSILWQRMQKAKNLTERLFNNEPLHDMDRWYRDQWNRVRHHLGLDSDEQFIPYALRHTCATRLASRGVDLRTVMAWMGHKNIATTMRYAQFYPKNLLDAVKVLDMAEAAE